MRTTSFNNGNLFRLSASSVSTATRSWQIIRKSIGSARSQLIGQFFSESLLVALLALLVSVLLVQLSLPFFNQVADKKLTLLNQTAKRAHPIPSTRQNNI
jgi:hypothetical protein